MTSKTDVAAFLQGDRTDAPPRMGQRLDATRFLPEAGNTVVCHLDTGAPSHEAVLEARRRMQALPGTECFLFTPVESVHMTVFEGVIDTRRTADAWPAGMDRDAPVDAVTEYLEDRLTRYTPPPPFKVKAIGLRPTGLQLAGATAADVAILQEWRDTLVDPFGYRQAEHDSYRFHMTFAYPIAWLPDELAPVWERELTAILDDLVAAAPVIPLKPAAFCRFADMTYFEELLVLEQPAS